MAQKLVLVVTPDIASISNAFKTKIVAERLNVEPIGVVVNRATYKDVDIPIDEIRSALELPVLAVIPEDSSIKRSVALGEPIVIHNPKSPSAKEFKKLASSLVKISEAS
jgi:septum site-determining protein MinD